MQYMLLIYEDESTYAAPGAMEAVVQAHMAYTEELAQAGVLRGGNGLEPVATAKTIRTGRGQHVVLDGPFAETKEQLGGYYLIEVAHLETAIEWARKIPMAGEGAVEVRPVIDMPPPG